MEAKGARRLRAVPWVIWLAVGVHWVWAVCAFVNYEPLSAFFDLLLTVHLGWPLTAALFASVGVLAAVSLNRGHRMSVAWHVGLLLPQQAMLMVSAAGSILTSIEGHAPLNTAPVDSVVAVAVMAPTVGIAIFHTLAILDMFGVFGWTRLPLPSHSLL